MSKRKKKSFSISDLDITTTLLETERLKYENKIKRLELEKQNLEFEVNRLREENEQLKELLEKASQTIKLLKEQLSSSSEVKELVEEPDIPDTSLGELFIKYLRNKHFKSG